MYHYTTTVYRLGVRENVVHLWHDYIPQQALEHPFLMHGLLALSALHLAYFRPHRSSEYLQTCDKHQDIALRKFREILSSPPDPELADPAFALAATLSVSSMARSCARADTAAVDLDAVIELFILTRGVRDVIQLSHKRTRAGPMVVMLEGRPYPKDTEVHLPLSVSSCFDSIRHMLFIYELDPEALQHCQSALTELQKLYNNIAYIAPTHNIEIGDLSRWQVIVSMDYIRLVQARNPPALVILAHYAAAMTAIRTAWYTQNWAEYALHGISEALDDSMQHWIRWPMEQVHARLSELGVRSLEE